MTYESNKAHKPADWHPWRGNPNSTSRWKHQDTQPPETERICTRCGQTKPVAEFPPNRANGVRRTHCKSCEQDRKRATSSRRPFGGHACRKANPERYNAATRRARAKRLGYPEVLRSAWGTVRAAVELGVDPATVARMCVDGRLVAIKRANKWYIAPESVAEQKKLRGEA